MLTSAMAEDESRRRRAPRRDTGESEETASEPRDGLEPRELKQRGQRPEFGRDRAASESPGLFAAASWIARRDALHVVLNVELYSTITYFRTYFLICSKRRRKNDSGLKRKYRRFDE